MLAARPGTLWCQRISRRTSCCSTTSTGYARLTPASWGSSRSNWNWRSASNATITLSPSALLRKSRCRLWPWILTLKSLAPSSCRDIATPCPCFRNFWSMKRRVPSRRPSNSSIWRRSVRKGISGRGLPDAPGRAYAVQSDHGGAPNCGRQKSGDDIAGEVDTQVDARTTDGGDQRGGRAPDNDSQQQKLDAGHEQPGEHAVETKRREGMSAGKTPGVWRCSIKGRGPQSMKCVL